MNAIVWTPSQERTIKTITPWLKKSGKQQVFRLFGWAGTGKTFLARELAGMVKGNVLFACFTGKASLCLRKAGCEGASTIHSLIYKAVQDPVTGHVEFVLNRESALVTAKLLIIDEVSMVDNKLAEDLLSFGIPILVLGDPFQLPPVKGDGYFTTAEPDAMLTDIRRQEADNPIIRLSMDIREGRGMAVGQYGSSRVVRRADIDRDEMQSLVLAADQVICGMNKTRQSMNSRMRVLRGYEGLHPVKGEKLICLKNNHEKGLLNGGMWSVREITEYQEESKLILNNLDEPDMPPAYADVLVEFWQGREKSVDWRRQRNYDQFTFGGVITCHKSQGSQFPKIVVFDESQVFGEHADRWRYTAITRAQESAVVVA